MLAAASLTDTAVHGGLGVDEADVVLVDHTLGALLQEGLEAAGPGARQAGG
jgi:hypothetical protein